MRINNIVKLRAKIERGEFCVGTAILSRNIDRTLWSMTVILLQLPNGTPLRLRWRACQAEGMVCEPLEYGAGACMRRYWTTPWRSSSCACSRDSSTREAKLHASGHWTRCASFLRADAGRIGSFHYPWNITTIQQVNVHNDNF